VDDDGSGWHELLLAVWDDGVRDAVVDRLERTCTGRLGWFAQVFATPDASEAVTETVHALVVAAIRDETGANLDELGSQAAWDCYEAVWSAMAERWRDGGTLATVSLGAEPQVVRDLVALPPEAAAAAGADVGTAAPRPVWIRGRLRVDAAGLASYLQIDGGVVPAEIHERVVRILGSVEPSDGA
jgi:hypothetical protein